MGYSLLVGGSLVNKKKNIVAQSSAEIELDVCELLYMKVILDP